MFEHVKLVLKGGIIGVANIIPGVSGGTMAVVLGVYEDLIDAISNFFTNKEKRNFYVWFLLKIAFGAVVAILALSWVMDFLLLNYPKKTYLFFIGLIAGSIPSIYNAHDDMKPNISSVIAFFAGVLLILSFAWFFPEADKTKDIGFQYDATGSGLILLLVGGFFAGGSMIVPGISGSFVLVLLGQYRVVIIAIKELNFILLGVIAVGAGLGVWAFAKLINLLLKSFPKQTFYFILGLVVASLYPIFPGLPNGIIQASFAIMLAFLGAGIAYGLGNKKA